MRLLGVVVLAMISAPAGAAECSGTADAAKAELAAAMAEIDSARIATAIASLSCHLATLAPERPERYASPPPSVALNSFLRSSAWALLWRDVDKRTWWTDPARKPEALRVPAEVVQASLVAAHIPGADSTVAIARARMAGDYLLTVQAAGGTGVFGFPMDAAPGSEAEMLIRRFLTEARARGIVDRVAHGGWVIDDLGNGDLNYDNGLAGQALLALWRTTHDDRYLEGARRAGKWAMTRPIVPNFNYNGFSAALLADLFKATRQRSFLDDAVRRVELGVLSGQIEGGPNDGSWIDPHNKRLVYRYIMIGQLAEVLAALPDGHPSRPRILAATGRALRAVETQQVAAGGVGNLNSAIVAYCKLARLPSPLAAAIGRPGMIRDQLWALTGQSLVEGRPQAGAAAIACYLSSA